MHFAIMGRILDYEGFGIQTYLLGLLNGLAAVRPQHRITVLLSPGQSLPKELELAKIEAFGIGSAAQGSLGKLVWDHLSVGRACRTLKVDALLAPAHIRPWYAPCPVVVTVHDMLYHLQPEDWSWFDQAYFRLGVDHLTTRAALIHAVSESTRQDFLRRFDYPQDRVNVIAHGVPSGFAPQTQENGERLRQKYSLHKPYIFYAGSFHPRKNLEAALQAFEQLSGQVDHEFVIAGLPVWNEARMRQRLSSSPVAERIRLVGLVPRAELPVFYSQAEIFVFPSRYEGFGLPVLEAMACGCPVITTTASSLPEVAGDAALLVPPGDVQALKQEMLRLLCDAGLRQELRIRSLQRASQFSWETAASQMIGLLEAAASSAPSPRSRGDQVVL